MLNVEELEKKHKKYKSRISAPLFAVLTAAIAVSAASYLFISKQRSYTPDNPVSQEILTPKETNVKPDMSKQTTVAVASDVKEEPVQKEHEKTETETPNIKTEQQKIALSPSMGFLQNISTKQTAAVSVSAKKALEKEPEQEAAPVIIEQVEKEAAEVKTEKTVEKKTELKTAAPVQQTVKEETLETEHKSSINIKRKDDEADIKDVIRRFNNNHNPALSLFVAKKYYQLENYEQSYNYALITNEINNEIEASWIIFAKSLVKLGKKEEAVQTLKKYIQHSGSSQAKQLLDEVLSGKFR